MTSGRRAGREQRRLREAAARGAQVPGCWFSDMTHHDWHVCDMLTRTGLLGERGGKDSCRGQGGSGGPLFGNSYSLFG